jgi:putative membrane protein
MHFLLSLLINAVIVMIAAYIMPNVQVKSFGSALVVALLIGLLNPTIGWLLTFVLHLGTLGLFWLLGLGFIIRIIAFALVLKIIDRLTSGFHIKGFGAALILAILLAVLGTIVHHFTDRKDSDTEARLRVEMFERQLS